MHWAQTSLTNTCLSTMASLGIGGEGLVLESPWIYNQHVQIPSINLLTSSHTLESSLDCLYLTQCKHYGNNDMGKSYMFGMNTGFSLKEHFL